MARETPRYATQLLVEFLGPGETETRFDWCRGDSRDPAGVGRALTFDAACGFASVASAPWAMLFRTF